MFESHPSPEELEHYALEQLSRSGRGRFEPLAPEALAALEEHLLWCHQCLDCVEQEMETVRLILAAARQTESLCAKA